MHWTGQLFLAAVFVVIVGGFLRILYNWNKRRKQYDEVENMCRGAASAGAKRGGRG